MLCYLSLPVCAPAGCSACGTCFLLIWYSRSHRAHAFLHQSWAGFVRGGGISFLCKQREICTSLVGIAGYCPGCFAALFQALSYSVCIMSGRTELLTRSRSHASHHSFFWGGVNLFVFTQLLFILIRKRENNLFLHIYVF